MLDTAPALNAEHNNPPPYIAWETHAESLSELAEGLTAITNDEQAATVGNLARDVKDALSDVKKAVTAERKPHKDAADAVSEAYKPTITILERVKTATLALSDAWMREQRRKEQEAAAEARRIADAADAEARRIAAEADQTDVAELEKAGEAANDAKYAAQEARAAKSVKTTVEGIQYRTVGYNVKHADRKAHLTHVAKTDPDAIAAFLIDHGEREARRTKGAAIPGCTVEPIKRAV